MLLILPPSWYGVELRIGVLIALSETCIRVADQGNDIFVAM
jgi:hypothetical protein